MGDEMGFAVPNMSPSTTKLVASTTHREIWHGSTNFTISGDGLLYVRLTGLTFESQNGAVQGPSRIIQPLARFTEGERNIEWQPCQLGATRPPHRPRQAAQTSPPKPG